MRMRAAVFVFVAILTGWYYRWAVRAAGEEFRWGQNIDGYYNLLARGFAAGHLYLPFEVNPQLLAQANPYDPALDDSLKLFDAALYNRRYYLYHGAGPAILLFLPWRLVTGHDLSENFASFLFCFGGFLFSGAALLGMLRLAGREPGPLTTALLLLALGFCTGVPFLLNRTWVYEIAIAGGYFWTSAAIWFLLRGLASGNRAWMAAAGLGFGFAVACRPHLGLFALAATAVILLRARRSLLPFLLPLALAGLAIGAYNFERFGNPAEFGIGYLLTGRNQNRVKLEWQNVAPTSFYLLAAPPETSTAFPWLRMAWPPRDIPRPNEFFLEPSIGAIWLAPFLPALLLVPLLGRARLPAVLLACAAAGVFLFLALTGWSTQRYEVDFLPVLVWTSLAGAATLRHAVLRSLLTVLILFGLVVNLALGVTGPIDEMIQKRPDRYVRLAAMFTPRGPRSLLLSPPFTLTCPAGGLLHFAAGTPLYRYELLLEQNRIVSRRAGSEVTAVPVIGEYTVAYVPATGEIILSIAGSEVLRHKIGALVVSRSDLDSACAGRARAKAL